MPRLKDRQRQIPGGFVMELPALGWRSSPFASFDVIVDQVVRIIKANPKLALEQDWPSDRQRVAEWVDQENARRCWENHWTDFYLAGGDAPVHAALPFDSWPLWARSIARLRAQGDQGVGDTVERIIGPDNGDKLKAWYQKTFHRVCGCDGRKADWNIKYNYKNHVITLE